ncbi:MAG TPA: DNA-formamidopyrimidine glycosylase family protein [Planctomycetota bacterium]|nr:DNA-formamidopyrimidine glycosylase family protein [Planctomycetota bacterium]
MPELPDVTVYVERLADLLVGRTLRHVRIRSPFLLRTVEPPLSAAEGRTIAGVRRMGKRIVLELRAAGTQPAAASAEPLFLVLHLMIAGRLKWGAPDAGIPGKIGLAAFDVDDGTLLLTEAGSKKRASLHLLAGEAALAAHDRGGLEVMEASAADFAAVLRRENHTLKRALTDPRLLSGIGNAYSDEILHRARLSPFIQTGTMSDEQFAALLAATRAVLGEWTARLREEAVADARAGHALPRKVTAFRPGMAVHGRYGQPCPVCGAPVQRILYAENEANYCAKCQTGGKLLADRVLSRLMKDDWPRTLEELEERKREGRG